MTRTPIDDPASSGQTPEDPPRPGVPVKSNLLDDPGAARPAAGTGVVDPEEKADSSDDGTDGPKGPDGPDGPDGPTGPGAGGDPAAETPPPPKREPPLANIASIVIWGALGFTVLIAFWGLFAPDRLPSPADVAARLISDISDPVGPEGILLLLGLSLGRVAEGFILAAIVGIPLGLMMGQSKTWWNAANPVVQLLRPVSPLAWFPIFAVIFMNSEQASIWVIFVTALWPIVINTADGASQIPEDQKKVAKVFEFGRVAYVRHVLLPNTLSSIVTGMRTAFGMAWLVIVAVEMLGTAMGIGNDTWEAYNGSNFDQMMANIIWIGLIGLIADALFIKAVDFLTKKENK